MNKVLLATLGYALGTIILSMIWYLVLFSSQYQSFNLIEHNETSNFVLWIISVLVLGFVISYFYNYLHSDREVAIAKYVSVVALLSWCYTVLAILSWIWQGVDNLWLFIVLATAFIIIQYVIYGVILRWVFSRSTATSS